jgi:hypothetical protein
MKRVLLLTDSRGVHRPAGTTHQMYADKLAKTPGINLTSIRCPFQWTTTLDLLRVLDLEGPENFDHVILHAGIVDQSPRALSSMMNRLVDPEDGISSDEADRLIAARDFSKKIVNRKRPLLEAMFGKESVDAHFSQPFDQQYEGEPTINLYSLDMMKASLLPRLRKNPNLIFISSNNFSREWQGDYPKARPDNIYMIEDYSRALCEGLDHVVNLHQWSEPQVRRFTCDNLHLTEDGSNWIHKRLTEEMGLRTRDYFENRRSVWPPATGQTPWPIVGVSDKASVSEIKMTQPEPLTDSDIAALRVKHGLPDGPLATLVIGFRLGSDEDKSRLENMRHLVQYLGRTYPSAFDILLIEQDKTQKFERDSEFDGCRYAFLYNPNAYNRGWLYNVAVKHFTSAPVVGFLDTDILPGANFMDAVLDCVSSFDAVSPNRSLFYSTPEQTEEFRQTGRFDHFPVTEQGIKNPTTLAGGMLVVNREAFLSIGGFEQYVGYGCEDRALDVTMFTLLPPERVRVDSQAYFHQHHPIIEAERVYFRDIYRHMVENYGCEYTPGMTPTDYIHKNCCHAGKNKVASLRDVRMSHIGDPELYRKNGNVTVNGLPGKAIPGVTLIPVESSEPVFPPEFDGVNSYFDSEHLTGRFANAWAPAVKPEIAVDDTRQLQFFYNRFKGKRCFIVGNGPSLNDHDLSLLKNEYTFAVNSIYYKTRETGFTPTFFVVEDSSVIKENHQEILEYEAPFKFFPTIYQSLHPKRPGTYFFPINRGFYDKFSPNYAIPRFSTDISKIAYCGQSVTYINLQLAYYMGFTEIYLIGMDFSYLIPASHTRKGDILTSDTDDPNHFHKDYFGKGKTWKDPKLDRVLMNYRMAKLAYECAGRRIFNATKGGHLEEFERVDYDSLFGGLDQRFDRGPLNLARPAEALSRLKNAGPNKAAEPAKAAVQAAPPAKPAPAVVPAPAEVKSLVLPAENRKFSPAETKVFNLAGALLLSPAQALATMESDQETKAMVQNIRVSRDLNPELADQFEKCLAHAKKKVAATA